jgi:tryptophan 2,3-dioxygenase
MATVNFSVPEDVKALFNEVFADRNKSAIIAELMMEAVEREHRRQRHVAAIDRILARRESAPEADSDRILDVLEAERP